MERGARALLFILIGALLVGAAVVAVMPVYRATAIALFRGHPYDALIWRSNEGYYAEVGFFTDPDDEPAQ